MYLRTFLKYILEEELVLSLKSDYRDNRTGEIKSKPMQKIIIGNAFRTEETQEDVIILNNEYLDLNLDIELTIKEGTLFIKNNGLLFKLRDNQFEMETHIVKTSPLRSNLYVSNIYYIELAFYITHMSISFIQGDTNVNYKIEYRKIKKLHGDITIHSRVKPENFKNYRISETVNNVELLQDTIEEVVKRCCD